MKADQLSKDAASGGMMRMLATLLLAATIASCASSHTQNSFQRPVRWEPQPLSQQDSLWLDSVTLDLFHCTKKLDNGGSYGFFLVGEVHLYNSSTSRFADSLLALMQPGHFLSEGAKFSGDTTEMDRNFLKLREFAGEHGLNEPELSKLAELRGIPVVFLERRDSVTGTYEGVTPDESVALEASLKAFNRVEGRPSRIMRNLMLQMMEDPEKLFGQVLKMMEAFGIDSTTLMNIEVPRSGIIDTRNEIMASRALPFVDPDSGCTLIRFGKAHVQGMIELLKNNECDCEPVSLTEWFTANR